MRFKGFDLNLLVALDALLAEQSVSRAAERLNLTQPATSAALSRLRGYFHDDILTPFGKKMMPTSHAESVAPILAEVLVGIERLISTSTVFDPAQSQRTFRIGASDYITTVLLTPLLPALEKAAPGIKLQITLPSQDVIDRLNRGEIDLLLTPEDYVAPDHPTELLFEEGHVVVGWDQNPVFSRPLTEEAFFSQGHVVVELGRNQAKSFAETQMDRLGKHRRIEIVAPFFSAIPWMLPNTLRLATMHERLAKALIHNLPLTIAPMPFPFPPMREMIQYHRTREYDGGLRWLLGQIRDHAAEARRMDRPLI